MFLSKLSNGFREKESKTAMAKAKVSIKMTKEQIMVTTNPYL